MIDRGQISGARFMAAAACFISSSSLLTAYLYAVTEQDAWLVVLAGIAVGLSLMWLYRSLMVAFPGMNLIQMLEAAFGTVAGKVLGLLYLWFFMTLASLNLVDLGDLTKLTLMDELPTLAIVVMCALVCAYVIRNGVRAVTWYGMLYLVILVVIVAITVLLVANQMLFRNFLPILDIPPLKFVQGVHIITTIPFGELIAILMIAPNVRLSSREIGKYLIWGFLIGAGTLLVVVMRDIAVLGNTIHLFAQPSLVTLRLVRLGEALSRMEILFVVILILLLFFKITLLGYASVMSLAQIFNVKSPKHLALASTAFMVAYGFTLYPDPIEHAASGQNITATAWTLFQILLPLVLLIVAKIRGFPKKAEV